MMKRGKNPIVYVTRDIERALGMTPSNDYIVISNRTPYSETIKNQYPDFVYLIDSGEKILDTSELLEHREVQSIILEKKADILVFKNTTGIEALCKKNNWTLLNPSATLAEKVENKITQVEWLGEIGTKYLPTHTIAPTANLKWNKIPSVIQWAHSHTGEGTILINSENELRAIQAKFPNREARLTTFVHGPSFTVNVVMTKEKILTGNISYQITGLFPFTDNVFSTIGNDWSVTHSLLTEAETGYIETMAREIGEKLKNDGWRGLFGIDVIKDIHSDHIFLIEINVRQPASTTFESILQEENRQQGISGITTYEAHIISLCNQKMSDALIIINDGAQIIQRITKTCTHTSEKMLEALGTAGFDVITYSNSEYNSDLARIQSRKGIMEGHAKFNARGKEISNILLT